MYIYHALINALSRTVLCEHKHKNNNNNNSNKKTRGGWRCLKIFKTNNHIFEEPLRTAKKPIIALSTW